MMLNDVDRALIRRLEALAVQGEDQHRAAEAALLGIQACPGRLALAFRNTKLPAPATTNET